MFHFICACVFVCLCVCVVIYMSSVATDAASIFFFIAKFTARWSCALSNWKHTKARTRSCVHNIFNVNVVCIWMCMCIYSLHKFAANEITNMKWHVWLKWSTQDQTSELIDECYAQAEKWRKKSFFSRLDSMYIVQCVHVYKYILFLSLHLIYKINMYTPHFHYNSNEIKLIKLLIKVNVHWSLFI